MMKKTIDSLIIDERARAKTAHMMSDENDLSGSHKLSDAQLANLNMESKIQQMKAREKQLERKVEMATDIQKRSEENTSIMRQKYDELEKDWKKIQD